MWPFFLPFGYQYLCKMWQLGKIQELQVLRDTSAGLYLGTEENPVLLPGKFAGVSKPGDLLKVFIYTDSEQRPIATANLPKCQVGDISCLQVKEVNEKGAFLDMGIEKDLFVPFAAQRNRLRKGEWCTVYIDVDPQSNRLVGDTRLRNFLDRDTSDFTKGQKVEVLIWEEAKEGIRVVVNGSYEGLVFFSDLYQEVSEGDKLEGYISKIRPDGKLDIRLGERGLAGMEKGSTQVLKVLEMNRGYLPFHDDSSPSEIMATFGMSKKLFKKSIGILYRQKLILIEDQGIRLIKNPDNNARV